MISTNFAIMLILVIWSIAALYFKKEDDNVFTAYKKSLEQFIRWCKHSEQMEYNPSGDIILGNKLRTQLEKFDARSSEYIGCIPCTYSAFNLPCVVLDLIPQNGEKDFPVIQHVMKSVFAAHMASLGRILLYCDVFIHPTSDSSYHVYICYATTEESKTTFERFLNFQLETERGKAIKSVRPPVDEEMEKDMAEVSYHDKD